MDPNAALTDIRNIIKDVQTPKMARTPEDAARYNASRLLTLAESIEALDGWLSKGGFFPTPWQHDDKSDDADDQPSHNNVWLGIGRKQANSMVLDMTELASMFHEHSETVISIYGAHGHDFALLMVRDNGDNEKETFWQCTRQTYAEALDMAVRKINSLPKPPEKMYLVHSCGESFDDMQEAAKHTCDDELDEQDNEWRLLPESEAM